MTAHHRPTPLWRILLAGAVAVLLLSLPTSACAESNPFFPSSSSSTHTTIKALSSSKAAKSTTTATSSTPNSTSPAAARIKTNSGASTPDSSTTVFRPASETVSSARALSTPTQVGSQRSGTSPRARSSSSSTSSTAVIAAILAALALLTSLAWAVSRLLVYEPTWVLSLRHSLEETSFRVSAAVAEFADWVRLGR